MSNVTFFIMNWGGEGNVVFNATSNSISSEKNMFKSNLECVVLLSKSYLNQKSI